MTSDQKLATYVLGNYGRYPIWPVRGEGARVWDRDGKEYLDFAGGVAVCPVGHCHPNIVQAITRQAQTLIHVSNWYCIEGQADLAELLVTEVVRQPGKVFFCNSGAEANEGMLKLARRYGAQKPKADGSPRRKVISFTGSFHGRTLGAMFATAQEKIWGGFGLRPEDLGNVYVPFNDCAALEAAISDDVVAIMLEPIQGESGVNPVTAEFLRTAQALCRKHDLLLLLDEVQCSFGRAGEMAGWRSIVPGNEIQPHAVSWAKAIGSGYPLGAFWARDGEVASLLGPGSHGTTYGGSPLACAVGLATIRTILADDLCAHAKSIGSDIASEVRGWHGSLITTVRQFGLFIGFELDAAKIEKNSNGKAASIYLAGKLLDAGLMTVPAGPSVIRWLPPLNISREEAQRGLGIMRDVMAAIA